MKLIFSLLDFDDCGKFSLSFMISDFNPKSILESNILLNLNKDHINTVSSSDQCSALGQF